MKPDIEVFRKILTSVQEMPSEKLPITKLEGIEDEVFYFHTRLLKEQNLVNANVLECEYPPQVECVDIYGLSAEGHQLLRVMKNSNKWEKVKSFALKTTGTLTLGLLSEYIKNKIK